MKNIKITEEMECLTGIEKRIKMISSMPGDPKKVLELQQSYINTAEEIMTSALTSPFTKKYFEKIISKYKI